MGNRDQWGKSHNRAGYNKGLSSTPYSCRLKLWLPYLKKNAN